VILHTILYYLVLLPASVFYGGTAIVAGLIGVPRKPDGVYDWCARNWSKAILWAAGIRIVVHGLEHVPRDRPVVYSCNHTSMFDIWAVAATLPGTVRYVAKIEIRSWPIIGRAMAAAGHIFIDRGNRPEAIRGLEEAGRVIREGLSAIIFPEGTRTRTGEIQPFKKGAFVLAIAAQVPVLPMYVHNAFEIMPKGRFVVRPRPIHLSFGEPIPTAGMTYEDRGRLMDLTRNAMLELRRRVDAISAVH
jgi:1-acyl-sn-glycerol-3-phosphate acyltransferase